MIFLVNIDFSSYGDNSKILGSLFPLIGKGVSRSKEKSRPLCLTNRAHNHCSDAFCDLQALVLLQDPSATWRSLRSSYL